MAKKKSTFRLQVTGGKELQRIYKKLSEGMPVDLIPEGEKVNVYYEKAKFFGSKSEYLGYLTKSDDILRQLERGHKITGTKVAGFYEESWGQQLIIKVTVEKENTRKNQR